MSSYLSLLCTSRVVTKALTIFVTNPNQSYRTRELAAMIDEDSGNVKRFLVTLVECGFLIREEVASRHVYYRANPDCTVLRSIKRLATEHYVQGRAAK